MLKLCAVVAQSVERILGKDEVGSSSLLNSSSVYRIGTGTLVPNFFRRITLFF